jgi:peptide-methionine (S)-S-oxide reductase
MTRAAHPERFIGRYRVMKPYAAVLVLILGLTAAAPASAPRERVVLAGGCFWGMQLVFESLRGVDTAVAGYAGGDAATAHYETVSTGTTGHAESVEVTYDPDRISFKQLLDVYFLVAHDPTQLDRQGPDVGSQYRSEVFYTTTEQRADALSYIAHLSHEGVYSGKIVTIVAPLRGFYPAEAYHQNYAVHNPDDPYIVFNDLPKLRKLRQEFPQLVSTNAPLK